MGLDSGRDSYLKALIIVPFAKVRKLLAPPMFKAHPILPPLTPPVVRVADRDREGKTRWRGSYFYHFVWTAPCAWHPHDFKVHGPEVHALVHGYRVYCTYCKGYTSICFHLIGIYLLASHAQILYMSRSNNYCTHTLLQSAEHETA
jgi:hypothetical protein